MIKAILLIVGFSEYNDLMLALALENVYLLQEVVERAIGRRRNHANFKTVEISSHRMVSVGRCPVAVAIVHHHRRIILSL